MAAKTGINGTQRTQECHTSSNDRYQASIYMSQTITLVKNEVSRCKKTSNLTFRSVLIWLT